MKNTTWTALLLILQILFAQNISSQCSESSYSFGTQNEVDNFPSQHPNCTEIPGNLIILESSITNLDSLYQIVSVGNRISIRGNSQLENLNGLSNIISSKDLEISNNDNLINASGIANIQELDGTFVLVSNPRLQTFVGLNLPENIDKVIVADNDSIFYLNAFNDAIEINNFTAIRNNPRLSSLDICKSAKNIENITIEGLDRLIDFSGLDSLLVADTIRIIDNEQLILLPALSKLITIDGQLIIKNNDTLLLTDEFSNLQYINDGLIIENNRNLKHFVEGNKLEIIGERVEFVSNKNLENIDVLANLDYNLTDTLLLLENASLSTCGNRYVCDLIRDASKYHQISNNQIGCNTAEEILDWCLVDVNDIGTTVVSIYPNPVSERLYIDIVNEAPPIRSIEIFNSLGHSIIYQEGITDYISTNHLLTGQYFIQIHLADRIITSTFIK